MESFQLEFQPTSNESVTKSFVGVVSSGDLEILVEPNTDNKIIFRMKTSVNEKQSFWNTFFKRELENSKIPACTIFINDFGASPAVMQMRLQQIIGKGVGQ